MTIDMQIFIFALNTIKPQYCCRLEADKRHQIHATTTTKKKQQIAARVFSNNSENTVKRSKQCEQRQAARK